MPLEIPARTAARITGLALRFFVCLTVAGCAPKDPLNWKISAATPDDFNDWCQHKLHRMPQNLVIELNTSFDIIFNKVELNRAAVVHDNGFDPFCQRVNHLPIRDVIADACQIEDESLLSEIIHTQDAMTENIDRSFSADAAEQERFKQAIDYQKKGIDELNKELQHNRARIKELESELDNK
jgi:hypothetical protein